MLFLSAKKKEVFRSKELIRNRKKLCRQPFQKDCFSPSARNRGERKRPLKKYGAPFRKTASVEHLRIKASLQSFHRVKLKPVSRSFPPCKEGGTVFRTFFLNTLSAPQEKKNIPLLGLRSSKRLLHCPSEILFFPYRAEDVFLSPREPFYIFFLCCKDKYHCSDSALLHTFIGFSIEKVL